MDVKKLWVPILVTIIIASNGFTVNLVNNKFTDHEKRPHIGSVVKEEYTYLRTDVKVLQAKVDRLAQHIIRLETLIEGGGIHKNGK